MIEIITVNESYRFNFLIWCSFFFLLALHFFFLLHSLRCLSIRKFWNEIVADGITLFAAPTITIVTTVENGSERERKRSGCRQQKHWKRTKTINNAGRVECVAFALTSIFTNLSTFRFTLQSFLVYLMCYKRLTHSHSIIYFVNIESFSFDFDAFFFLFFYFKRNLNEIKETKQLLLPKEEKKREKKKIAFRISYWINRFLCECVTILVQYCKLPNEKDLSDSIK